MRVPGVCRYTTSISRGSYDTGTSHRPFWRALSNQRSSIANGQVSEKGPLGTLNQALSSNVKIERVENRLEFTALDGSMISGTWEATTGTWHATYQFYEFVHLIEGRITITPDGGAPVTLNPGDAFVVEPNFKGTWKIEAPVRKHFAIKLK